MKWIPRFRLEIQEKITRGLAEDCKRFIAGRVENCGQGIRLGGVKRKLLGQNDWERFPGTRLT